MQQTEIPRLTAAIYDATINPDAWREVMDLLRQRFASRAEAFYFLDYDNRDIGKVHVRGVDPRYHACFEELFYTPDNPWIRAGALHRAGVVRTVERLHEHFRDPRVLQRSQYYNEWMKPQGMENTIGGTLLAEDNVVANLTLLRPDKKGPYGPQDLADFSQICGHFKRALQIARRLEAAATSGGGCAEALDRLCFGALLLNVKGRLLHANRTAETLLRTRDGIALRRGRVVAVQHGAQQNLTALLAQLALGPAAADGQPPTNVVLPRRDGKKPLLVSGLRLSGARGAFAPPEPTILLLLSRPGAVRARNFALVRQLYGLTPAEARLAQALLGGGSLRHAAEQAGVTYETARWYLKILFQKTGASRQAELVARLLADLALPS